MSGAGVVTHRQRDMPNIICAFMQHFLANAQKCNISNISEHTVLLDPVTIARVAQHVDRVYFIFMQAHCTVLIIKLFYTYLACNHIT
jgi:hypothetical protein